jgi:hypothetical protein
MTATDPAVTAQEPLTRFLRIARPMQRGDDIVLLQSRLQTGGWPAAVAGQIRSVDGLFGPGTEGAVRAFQQAYGLDPDGAVGPETWSRLWLPPNATAEQVSTIRSQAADAFSPACQTTPEQLEALAAFHCRFAGGVNWRLGAAGIELDRGTIPVTTQHRARARTVLGEWFADPIRKQAAAKKVPVELIVATICTESAGDRANSESSAKAERREPGFQSYGATPHRVSIGCMQTLILTACVVLGRTVGPDDLRDAAVSIEAGTACIAEAAAKTRLDPPVVACAYNAGGVYLEPSAANRWRMRQFPIGTSAHADRFVAFFNACLLEVKDTPTLAGNAPAFATIV